MPNDRPFGERPVLARAEPDLSSSMWTATAGSGVESDQTIGTEECDVAIIGGGFTGCSAALHLAKNGARVVVLEAQEIGSGASGRNAGLLNPGLQMDPDEMARRLGPEVGSGLIDLLSGAPELVREIVREHNIDCALDGKGVIRAAHSEDAMRSVEAHAEQWRSRGADIETLSRQGIADMTGTDRYVGGLIDHRSASIQPLAFVRGLAKAAQRHDAKILQRTPVIGISRNNGKWRVATDLGVLKAEKIIVATNAYSGNLIPGLRHRIVPIGSFAYATRPLDPETIDRVLPAGRSLYDTQKATLFVRRDLAGRLMIGTLGYLPSNIFGGADAWADRVVRRLFPFMKDFDWEFRWSGTLGLTSDFLPRLVEPGPGALALIGCNGRGIAPGTCFGMEMAKCMLGQKADLPLAVDTEGAVRFRSFKAETMELAFKLYRGTSRFP